MSGDRQARLRLPVNQDSDKINSVGFGLSPAILLFYTPHSGLTFFSLSENAAFDFIMHLLLVQNVLLKNLNFAL